MDDDPYKTLGVSRNATGSEIKSAYRKLALKYHPDKQHARATTANVDKSHHSDLFTKIGNAYETLSDPELRKQYDGRRMTNRDTVQTPFHNPFFHDPFFHDPFFTGRSGRRGNNRRHHDHNFTDPFDLFHRVFSDEFGFQQSSSQHRSRAGSSRHGGHPFANNFFEGDSFFQRSGMSMGGVPSLFGPSMSAHNMMHPMMRQGQQSMASMNRNGGNSFSYSSYSSSSSSSNRNSNGKSESVSTSTKIVNGKRESVTERVIHNPDGTVERKVETFQHDDLPQRSVTTANIQDGTAESPRRQNKKARKLGRSLK